MEEWAAVGGDAGEGGSGVGLEFGRGGRLEASGGWQWGQWGRQLQCNPASRRTQSSTASDIRVQRRPSVLRWYTAMVLRCTPTPTSLALAATRHTGTNAPCCHSPDKHTHIHTHTRTLLPQSGRQSPDVDAKWPKFSHTHGSFSSDATLALLIFLSRRPHTPGICPRRTLSPYPSAIPERAGRRRW